MQLKLFTAANAQQMEEFISQWLIELKADVEPESKYLTNIKAATGEYVQIHQLFQMVQSIPADPSILQMNQQQQPMYQLCVFIFYTLK